MFIHSKRFSYLPLLILGISSLAIFSPALRHSFLVNWDDNQYVVGNSIAHGLTFENIKGAFTNNFVGNYAPIQMISYMFDYEIWGLRASGFIFINILLHAANGMLFYLLLRRLTSEKVWMFLASLIFLLHPVQVESVVWVSQRKNVLAMFFFLIGFHLYASYKKGEEKPRLGFYWLSFAAFGFSLLSKSVAVVFPLVMLLFDHSYRKKRDFRGLVFDKIPFILLATLFGVVALQSHSAQVQGGETSYHGGNLYTTFLTMIPVLIRYLTMILWPENLSVFYDPPIKTHGDSEVAVAALLSALLCLLGVMLFHRKRQIFFWFALFFIFLIPVSQIIPIVTLMNDRYLYFPMLGATAFLGATIFGNVGWSDLLNSRKYIPVSVFSILVIGACSVATLHRIPVWQNSYTLWGDAVKKVPNVPLAHDCFGEGLLERGQLDEALKEFEKALSLQPNVPTETLDTGVRNAKANTQNNIGAVYGMKGMTDEAIEHFAIAVQLNPRFDRAYFNLGNALMHKGLTDEALKSFETAVRLSPRNPAFQANLKLTREIIAKQSR